MPLSRMLAMRHRLRQGWEALLETMSRAKQASCEQSRIGFRGWRIVDKKRRSDRGWL